MAERRELDAIKVARRWRFRRSALDEYLQSEPARSGNTLATKEAEPTKQATQLDEEIQRIEIAKRWLALEKEQLELVGYALETAEKLVNRLVPDADEKTRARHLNAVLPRLLQSSTNRDLVSVLPVYRDEVEV